MNNVLRSHDNVGVDRPDMPQFDEGFVPNFLKYLKNLGIKYRFHEKYPVGLVKFTQRQIDLTKIQDMLASLDQKDLGVKGPYLVSYGGYLLDGHHRFITDLYGQSVSHVPVIIITINIHDLIDIAHEFLRGIDES